MYSPCFLCIVLSRGHAPAKFALRSCTKLQASLRLLSASTDGLRLPPVQYYTKKNYFVDCIDLLLSCHNSPDFLRL